MIADSFRTRRDILFCLPLNDGILPNQGSQPQHRTQQQHIITGSHFDEEMCLTGCHISHTEGETPAPGPASRCPQGCAVPGPPSSSTTASPDAAGQPDPRPAVWYPKVPREDKAATPLHLWGSTVWRAAAHGTYPLEGVSPGAAWAGKALGQRQGKGSWMSRGSAEEDAERPRLSELPLPSPQPTQGHLGCRLQQPRPAILSSSPLQPRALQRHLGAARPAGCLWDIRE